MKIRRYLSLTTLAAVVLALGMAAVSADEETLDQRRTRARAEMKSGNYKDALQTYSALALDPRNTLVGDDLNMAVSCMQNLGRLKEFDEFIEKVIKTHANNWRPLYSAANSYLNVEHNGFIVSGQFERGQHRGGGKAVNAYERDRIRSLQLMEQALQKVGSEKDKIAAAAFYLTFSDMLLANRGYREAWRLQYRSDLSKLPDYDEGYWHRGWGGGARGAPVDEEGNPVYHKIPRDFENATTDGERWRWMLIQAMEMNPGNRNGVLSRWAQFLRAQFDPSTMAAYSHYFRQAGDDDTQKNESGTYALHTLTETETIAKLANGIKRFPLPDEFNYVKLYRQIADDPAAGAHGEQALQALAEIFENRRQFDTAADFWQRSIKKYGPGNNNWKQQRVDQILNNWGTFEPLTTHPAGRGATFEFRFRNGDKVHFEARAIHTRQLLDDVKSYLKGNPGDLNWERVDIGNIGYRMVQGKMDKYLGDTVAAWDLDLQPRQMHFDKRITVTTPLQKAGAYWLTATMKNGNTCSAIIWVDDTVIVKKPLDKGAYYFVADAATGKPVAKANVEFFGYRQEYLDRKISVGRRYNVLTHNFAEFTDPSGQIILKQGRIPDNYSWLATATTPEGRLAYLGFSGIWFPQYYDQEYNQTKTLVITDRPVYRPLQPVKFKFWVRHAKYDQADTSSFANNAVQVEIRNPKGDKIFEKTLKTDEFGGAEDSLDLPKDATLGVYSITFPSHGYGQGSFRVEEYKKPEFEVTVEAPTEPVMLGEKITATIKAKYYFGSPVAKGKVKYKVTRTAHSANWYPIGIWDWFYGRGYWWFAYDYAWYPGWSEWGCKRPHFWWYPQPQQPPEIVADAEVQVGEDGTTRVLIDTAVAKAIHGHTDHKYELTAEVTDESRRTIVGVGTVLVARKPFKVHAWVDRGHYRVGDTVAAHFSAQTLDNKPVKGKGVLNLFALTYKDNKPVETPVQEWLLDTGDEGTSAVQVKASKAGQYRLSYKLKDSKGHVIEGGYVFAVMGQGTDARDFRFDEIELVPDKREYAPGEKVRLAINTDRKEGTVVLFTRPANGVYAEPKVIPLDGKSAAEEIEVSKKDMPNFFVEAFTIYDGKVHTDTREIIVPPEKRVLNVEVKPSATSYKPGEQATVDVKVTDLAGKPVVGSVVMSIYDKSVEYISGGSNVPEIKDFFWKWRRHHNSSMECTLQRHFQSLTRPGKPGMGSIGAFGHLIADEGNLPEEESDSLSGGGPRGGFGATASGGRRMLKAAMADGMLTEASMALPAAPMAAMDAVNAVGLEKKEQAGAPGAGPGQPQVQPTIRTKFADTAFWAGSLKTDPDGFAKINLTMPENLTGWKVRTWALTHGTKVGETSVEVVTAKNLMVRMQAPRFFVEKDEVVLSANVHNYLSKEKSVEVVLEVQGTSSNKTLAVQDRARQTIKIKAGGEQRVDWKVKVLAEGEAVVRMKALTDEESDALEMKFPVYIHGMLKTESFSGVIRPDKDTATVTFTVPKERRMDQSRLEARFSPTLAGAMVDALPYMLDYPYGCTEQTLNRFLPSVITQKILMDMGLDLKQIKEKRTNLNAQEIGDDKTRAAQWKKEDKTVDRDGNWVKKEAVFDKDAMQDIVKEGLRMLTAMQCADGGWGWFSGYGEHSYPHTTAYVVHGLQIARENDVAIVPGTLERGVTWLQSQQAEQLRMLKNAAKKIDPWKEHAGDLDAFVYMVLVDAKQDNPEMREFLYRDRTQLSVYAKSMFGLALHKVADKEKLDMILQNIGQYLVQDDENQTAYLKLGNENYWWCWYGSENEAHAYYLKLLARTDPKGQTASRLVKYLLNNRKHATYWNSTRDTALCIEALADYLRKSGEDKPDMTVEVYVDSKKHKEVKINADNLFSFDNQCLLTGDAVEDGKHNLVFKKKGTGPLYFNAYLTYFTLEDNIKKAGLEIKVNRKYYKLIPVDKKIKVAGSRGQAVDQKVEKYERQPIENLGVLKSGDLVEVELSIDSKNDYEYIIFEDMKPAGFEPMEVRSGYTQNDLNAYVEFRDERVCFFARALARGNHSVSYRMRAEIPGQFSALPTRAYAMYAPELKANSDEIKLRVED